MPLILAPPLLAMSSHVALGQVGLSAILPTLHLLGRDAAAIPMTILSNHPGHPHFAAQPVPPDHLRDMQKALEQNGWLDQFETILTGYLPSAAHVAFARDLISQIKTANPAARYVCDPILGDDPKGVYIDIAAAEAIRHELIPPADIILPNRFELEWLSSTPVTKTEEAITAARRLGVARTIAKSIPHGPTELANIDIAADGASAVAVPRRTGVPNGTGDMLSALIAADWPLARATAALQAVIDASTGRNHLAIVGDRPAWLSVPPLPALPLKTTTT